jgi:hypothetical protein
MTTSRINTQFQEKSEDAFGDGNCAINASLLALCQPEIIAGIDRSIASRLDKPALDNAFSEFVAAVAPVLGVARTWCAVKQALVNRPNEENAKIEFQKKLAQPIRGLLFEKLSPKTAYGKKRMQVSFGALHSEFNDFVYAQLGIPKKASGDVYLSHFQAEFKQLFTEQDQQALIKEGFNLEEYKRLSALKNAQNIDSNDDQALQEINRLIESKIREPELSTWWTTQGYELFLKKMNKPGVHAGDLELYVFADYFNLNVKVRYLSAKGSKPHDLCTQQDPLAPTIMLEYDDNAVSILRHWDNVPLVSTEVQPSTEPVTVEVANNEKYAYANKVFDEYFDALEKKTNKGANLAEISEDQVKIDTALVAVHNAAAESRKRHGLFSIAPVKTVLDNVVAKTEELKNKPK